MVRNSCRYHHVKDHPTSENPHDGIVPMLIKQSYCLPTFSTLPVIALLSVYITQFYEKLGAKLPLIAFFIALARSLDVVTDPCMSYFTDSFRSKYGRRRPFCFTGCWFYATFLVMLLTPPDLSETGITVYFGVFYILFFLMNTFCNIPYDAIGPELTDNYEDRSRLFFISGLYDGVGSLVAMMIPLALKSVIKSRGVHADKCSDAPCFSTTGLGRDCQPKITTGEYKYYNLTFPGGVGGVGFNQSMYNTTFCNAHPDKFADVAYTGNDGILNFCKCLDACSKACDISNERTSFFTVGMFFGVWYVLFMINCVYRIRERSQLSCALPQPPPLVPSLLNTFNNKAFTMLLPAWACDAVVTAIIGSMMTYFVRYVVQAEFQTQAENGIDCNSGIKIPGQPSNTWRCDSTTILGLSVSLLLTCAFIGTPIWLFIAKKLGKQKAWCVLLLLPSSRDVY